MHEFLVSVVAFIVLVGVMVVVHEFGHFAVAKLCGVRVEAFSVGFGPRLFGIKYGDTDYKVCVLPLGGYVKMTGETPDQLSTSDDDDPEAKAERAPLAQDPGAFTSHPRWQRMLIGVAGPIANFILALVLMFIYYGWINEAPEHEVKTTNIEWVVPGSVAEKAGLQTGDLIRHFDTVDHPDWDQVDQHTALSQGQSVPVTVERNGAAVDVSLPLPPPVKGQDFDVTNVGIVPQFVPGPIGVQQVVAGTPAAKAGLQAGDEIDTVDGHAFHMVQTLLLYMQASAGKPMTLAVTRNGATLPPIVVQPEKEAEGWRMGFAPVPIPVGWHPLPAGAAFQRSVKICVQSSALIVEVLHRIFTHKVSVSQLSGPVGIARMAGDAAEMKGWLPKFGLATSISINLGILNLMPFPILDGGLILLLMIESVMRHDIAVNVKERIYQAAFVVLIAFFAFIIFNDVSRLPMFTHLKP